MVVLKKTIWSMSNLFVSYITIETLQFSPPLNVGRASPPTHISRLMTVIFVALAY
jgi:hypothetical protein